MRRRQDAGRELERELSRIDLDGPPIFETIAERVRDLLGAEQGLIVSYRAEATGSSVDWFALAGLSKPRATTVQHSFDAWIRRSSSAWAFYDPARPEEAQRNAVLQVGTWRDLAENRLPALLAATQASSAERRRRAEALAGGHPVFSLWGVEDAEQMRVLCCDGDELLAWVGGFSPDGYDERAAVRLGALVPALRRRLGAEARMRGATPKGMLAEAVLDQFPDPAWVLDGTGNTVCANALGRRALANDRGLHARLRAARREQGDPGFAVAELTTRGMYGHALVRARRAPRPPGSAVAWLASRFGLTPREREVAALLIVGRTNRSIAHRLGCSERTVETHVSRILAKCDCPSRAALIAEAWSS